ncbi:MAG: transglycosylase SLT domain-containing protein [Chitinispirillaceae bacterium]|nr:transglycosylase SLT domain-containing protein [Chitinispirillaceae bacterium]
MQTQGINSSFPGPKASPEQIQKVAKEFESIFTSIMLRSMRNTVGQNPLMPASFGEEVYTDMLDSEYAKLFANNATMGLSDLIIRELERQENRSSPLKALQNLKNSGNPWATDPRFVAQTLSKADAAAKTAAGQARNVNRWQPLIERASTLFGVDKHLISAVITQESGGNPRAVSAKGAKGLMQLMDTTAADMGVSAPYSPWANITGGTKYLRLLLDKFDGNERLALASYNAGPAAVERYGAVPPYRETRNYVESVLSLRRHFAILSSKEGE